MTKVVCENCVAEFECGADETACWCKTFSLARAIPKAFKKCLCPKCLATYVSQFPVEGHDFYWEGSVMVFTEAYHLKRGHCCRSSTAGCRHCPYR